MELIRHVSEGLARKTSRRGLFGRAAGIATGALMGAAAGTLSRTALADGGPGTVCKFPGLPCPCDGCRTNGVCAKPCGLMTQFYASGCWAISGFTCCDCDCNGLVPGFPTIQTCGCGSDYHNDPTRCPKGAG